ncbi:choice-of-anchor Q domain-containing protein [Streptomyces sp. NPDC091287]|uniref:choice-of-anchor Q domain-containing protein n=1 Tax=Streptomyces sp. NPDC091287 TaxID=3365988 RepID=UPI0037F4A5EE
MVSAMLLVVPLVSAPSAHAAPRDFFVSSASGSDTNDGRSAATPFKTIQKAADSTLPGDTVLIMNGTYGDINREGVVQISRSGSPGKVITYRPHPGHDPVIAPRTGWNGILIVGASYIKITGLQVRGDSDNLTLEDAEAGSKPSGPAFNTNCISARKDAVTGRSPHHITIRDNHVWDCPGSGISAIGSDHVTIDYNQVHSNSWYSTYATSGISVFHPVNADDYTGHKIFVRNNTVFDNEAKIKWHACDCYSDGNGIIVDDTLHRQDDDPAYTGRVLVENNLSFNNGGSGIHSYSSSGVDILNNTAYMNSRGRGINWPNIGAWDSKDVKVLNNISVAREGKETNFVHGNENVVYDHNIYFGGLAPRVTGPNDRITDPKLVAPGLDPWDSDFRPSAGSPAIDSGTETITEIDREGVPRPQGAGWDRGAYEYVTP